MPSVSIARDLLKLQHSLALNSVYVHQERSFVKRHRYPIILHPKDTASYRTWFLHTRKYKEKEKQVCTKNLKVERGRPLVIWVRVDGADDIMRQINDSHWFFPNESPANIMFFPFILNRNSAPLNLNPICTTIRKSWRYELYQMGLPKAQIPDEIELKGANFTETQEGVNIRGQVAILGLPSILEVVRVRTSVHQTIELTLHDGGTIRRFV